MSFAVKYNNGVKDVQDWYRGTTKTQSGTITAADGYNIVQIKRAYYGNNDVTYKFRFTKVTDQKYNYTFSLTQRDLDNLLQISDFSIHLDVVTEKIGAEPTIDLKVTYNNGLTYVTDTFKNQKAGTVKGTVQAATGYKITDFDSAYYLVAGMKNKLDNFTATKITDDKYSYSFDLSNDDIKELKSFNSTITLGLDAENPDDDDEYSDYDGDEFAPITIDTSKLVNCTISPTTVDPFVITDLTITANTGYILSGTGSYTVDGKTTSFTCNNVPSYKFTVNANTSISISFTASKPVQAEPSIDLQVTYNNGVENVVDLFKGQKAGTVKGTIQAAAGYTITGVNFAYYLIVGELTSLTNFTTTKISDYKYTYSFDLSDDDIVKLKRFNTPITIEIDTKKLPGNINIDVSKLVNCSITPATISQGKETTLTLNADNGYILNGTGSYTVDGSTNSFTCNNTHSYQLTVTANAYVYVFFTATKTETKTNSIVHTYVLSQDDYNNIGKQIIAGINSNGTGFDQYDYTNFVNYLYEIPFKVDDDITTSTSTINLGKQNINIDCQKVTRETLDIDLGSIDLTSVSSSHDYNPINLTLYCPFSNNIVLPATVIGSKLYLSFSINLKTEQALLLVKQNDNVIYSGQTEMFTDLPLYFTAGRQDTLVKKLKAQYQNTIKQAYVVINYHKPITGLTSYKTTEHGTLSNYKGFTRVSHGTLKRSINNTIDNSLLNLLRQGVIIK